MTCHMIDARGLKWCRIVQMTRTICKDVCTTACVPGVGLYLHMLYGIIDKERKSLTMLIKNSCLRRGAASTWQGLSASRPTVTRHHSPRQPLQPGLPSSSCRSPIASVSIRFLSESVDEADTTLARGFRHQSTDQVRPLYADLDISNCRATSLLTGRLASSYRPYVGTSC